MNNKISVTLGRIVESEIRVMHQGQPVVAGYRFVEALEKLCEDSMPVKEKYSVGKTHKQVMELVKLHGKRQSELIEKHGIKQSELLARERADVEADTTMPEHVKAKLLTRNAEQTAALVKHPDNDTHIIPAGDKEAFSKYEADMAVELAALHELFLDHKVVLLEGTKLTGIEMMAIEELVEVN